MAQGISKAKARQGTKKTRLGINARQKARLPAKAGKRRPPIADMKAPHITTEHDRKRGRRLSELGVKFYKRPAKWINFNMRETS